MCSNIIVILIPKSSEVIFTTFDDRDARWWWLHLYETRESKSAEWNIKEVPVSVIQMNNMKYLTDVCCERSLRIKYSRVPRDNIHPDRERLLLPRLHLMVDFCAICNKSADTNRYCHLFLKRRVKYNSNQQWLLKLDASAQMGSCFLIIYAATYCSSLQANSFRLEHAPVSVKEELFWICFCHSLLFVFSNTKPHKPTLDIYPCIVCLKHITAGVHGPGKTLIQNLAN